MAEELPFTVLLDGPLDEELIELLKKGSELLEKDPLIFAANLRPDLCRGVGTVERLIEKFSQSPSVKGLGKGNKELLAVVLAEKTSAPLGIVRMALNLAKAPVEEGNGVAEGVALNEVVKPVVHPAQDFVNDVLIYGVLLDEEPCWLTSLPRRMWTRDEISRVARIRGEPALCRFSSAGIKAFLAGEAVDSLRVYQEIRDRLKKHITFRYSWQAAVIALWIMGTYVYRLFAWYAYLWLNSPSMRSGKTLLEEILSSLCFNATPVLTSPTEAFLFRDPARNASTLILDEIESLTNADAEARGTIMAVLNTGFKRGGVVPRVEPRGKQYEVVYFETYSPKVLAGIRQLASTILDRCVKIEMWRKKKGERVERFNLRKLEPELQALRDRLYIFGLSCAGDIADFYARAEELPLPDGLDDRARDILEPLFSIAAVIDAKAETDSVTRELTEGAKAIGKLRAEEEAGDEVIISAIRALQEKFSQGGDKVVIRGTEALVLFHEAGIDWLEKEGQAKRILRQLGFRSGTHRTATGVIRGYEVKREVVEDLAVRYSPQEGEGGEKGA